MYRMQLILLILLLLNGLAATFGGVMMILDPTGASIHLPIEWLREAPFHNYTWPGIILLLSNGLLSLFIAWITYKGAMQYSYWALLQGFILIGFVTIECIMLGQFVGWLYIPSYVIGAGLIGIGFMLQD